MAKSVLELAVGTGQWDAGLKKAKQSLENFTQANGGLQQALGKDSASMQKFVQMMGQMDSTAKTAKGQMNDYKSTIEQLTMQYNRMTDAQKQTIGQDYLNSIDQLRQKYQSVNEEIQEMNRSLNNIEMPEMKGGGLFSGMGDKMSGALQVFAGNMLTKVAGAVAQLGSEMYDMVQQGIELAKQGEGIRIAFERLGRGDILDGLRQATHGTVTDIELMKAAVKFNDFKLPVEELGTMLAFAQQKAKDTGQSVDYMVDSIVTGLGRKSLMILDNLGLSATEVKDKMKETGDMTKAVGAIIREQMSKAGDYVETAADRAAQANVSLQNKMEELGRKFAPLEEASNNLWTSMKIGIMDIVGGPLTDFINKLTEAGRLANAYGVLGGTTKVGRMTKNLSSAKEENRQSIYQQQQEQFWRYINQREQQIEDIRSWQRGERGGALQSRISAITSKYGSLDVTKIQAEVNAAKKMLADYQQAAKSIFAPVKADIDTSGAEANVDSLKKKLKELEDQRKKAIAAGDTEQSKNLLKQINQVKSDIRGLNPKALSTNGSKTKTLKIEFDINKAALAATKADPNANFISPWSMADKDALREYLGIDKKQFDYGKDITEKDYKNLIGDIDDSKLYEAMDKLGGNIGKFAGGLGSISSGLKSMGVELPKEVDTVIGVISGLSQIITGVSTIIELFSTTSQAANTAAVTANTIAIGGLIAAVNANTFTSLIPGFARGGIVPHAANGYIVPGNSFSGDNTPIMANAGEVVLTQAMAGNLASRLSDQGRGMNIVGEIQGEKIVLVANRFFRRTGQGEIVTW